MTTEQNTTLVTVDVVPSGAITIDDATQRFDEFIAFVKSQMIDGEDMGLIPGTQKRTLLKPGAEKLCNFFGFAIEQPPDLIQRREEWDREPPRFAYEVHTIIRNKRTGIIESTGLGACNSMETKYRWRKGGADCPQCGEMLRRSKTNDEWYCWQKMGGCGETFPLADYSEQRVENTETADLQNTILKMAAKRSMVDAVLKATRGSGLFTQDMEDVSTSSPPPAQEAQEPAPAPRPRASRAAPPPEETEPAPAAPSGDFTTLGELYTWAHDKYGLTTQGVFKAADVKAGTGITEIGFKEAKLRIAEHQARVKQEAEA